ncbi:DNA/RNA-binding protein Alba (modular protein) [Nitrosopumilaceae archaeon]|nr:hypothetical protein [Nitrosopumilus sp.]MDA7954707.1 hypothetical protein [Nitrosopumilus sp.]MDA7959813.1 hypothetical protein [Nitrosopumilus sp.]CAI9832013.1 DNA/RNA-binding protein Alba (modular protein) [Nitrosopumilaceae archaeon]
MSDRESWGGGEDAGREGRWQRDAPDRDDPRDAPDAGQDAGYGQGGSQDGGQDRGQDTSQDRGQDTSQDRGQDRGGRPDREETRDTIYVGTKPFMAYVSTALLQLATLPTITIKARGMKIVRAVDIAEYLSRKDDIPCSIGDIRIGSEPLVSQDGKHRNVSTIEIEIKKTD